MHGTEGRPDLGERVDELEARVAFQEHALNGLGDALADARLEIARCTARLERALAEIGHLRSLLQSADPGDEPPPPHY